MQQPTLDRGRPCRRAIPAVLLACAASACGGDGTEIQGEVSVRDSAGVTIVVHPPGAMEAAERWTTAPEPTLRIGGRPDGSLDLASVTDGVRTDDGEIIAVDGESQEIRAYDADGPLWTLGGEDQEAVQFRQIRELYRLTGDTLGVLDTGTGRVSRLTTSGEFIDSAPLTFRPGPANPGVSPPLALHDGRLLVPGAPAGQRDTIQLQPLFLVDPATGSATLLDTVPRQPLLAASVGFPAWPRFGWATQLTATEDGVYLGTGQEYEVGRYDDGFALERLIRWSGPDRTITEEDEEEYLRLYARRTGTPPGQQAALRNDLARIPRAERKPAYFELRTDRAGNLWVRDADLGWLAPPDTLRWTVFDPEGRLIARAGMPGHLLPLEIGRDYILVRELRGDTAGYLAVHPLIRGGGPPR